MENFSEEVPEVGEIVELVIPPPKGAKDAGGGRIYQVKVVGRSINQDDCQLFLRSGFEDERIIDHLPDFCFYNLKSKKWTMQIRLSKNCYPFSYKPEIGLSPVKMSGRSFPLDIPRVGDLIRLTEPDDQISELEVLARLVLRPKTKSEIVIFLPGVIDEIRLDKKGRKRNWTANEYRDEKILVGGPTPRISVKVEVIKK